MQITLSDIEAALAPTGLMVLGCFQTEPADQVPGSPGAATLVLVGNAGPGMWRAFSASSPDTSSPHPLDEWTRTTLNAVADDLARDHQTGMQPLFPFDGPPYHPFQRWAIKSGKAYATPIGPLLHPRFGMWHAYRGAFVIEALLDLGIETTSGSPCETCTDKPCLTSCPVGAFTNPGYDVPGCLNLLEKEPAGPCFTTGCAARRACPVGQDYIYEAPQASFHMQKFLAAHRP